MTQDTSESGDDHGRVPMSADANFIGEASDEDGGDEGMKRKKKSSRIVDADEDNRRGWHFRFRRCGRQRLGEGVARDELAEREDEPDGDDVTAQRVEAGCRKTENEIHRSG